MLTDLHKGLLGRVTADNLRLQLGDERCQIRILKVGQILIHQQNALLERRLLQICLVQFRADPGLLDTEMLDTRIEIINRYGIGEPRCQIIFQLFEDAKNVLATCLGRHAQDMVAPSTPERSRRSSDI